MANQYKNKVVYNGTTLIDLSDTTAVQSDVAEGKYFYLATGEKVAGSGSGGGSITWELMADQTCTITTYEGTRVITINGYDEPLSANETYRITWDDNQYICNTIADPVGFTQDGYYMGNSSIFGSQYEDTGEPFALYRTSSTRMTGATNDTVSSVHVKIERQTTSSATLITKTITANGTYSAEDDDADGYSSVTVNVPNSAASSWTKVAETSYQVSTTSTYNVILRTGNTDIWTSDKLLYIRIRDTAGPRSGYFYGSDNFVPNFKALSGSETATTDNILKNCYKYSSGAYSTFSNSYGGRVTNVDSSGVITIPFRSSPSYSGTINGIYSIQVYLLDMPSGITIFE